MQDVTETFRYADPINASRVVFNIHGNDYRLIADIFFPKEVLFVKFLGTHAEYDRVDAETVNDF